MERLSRTTYFINVALLTALRGTCNKEKVGCVLVKDKRIIATGVNGSPSRLDHCLDVGCKEIDNHCIRASHAEQNVIALCSKHGISTNGCDIYTTHFPCPTCLKLLINAGIKRIYYLNDYKNEENDYLLEEVKEKHIIHVEKIENTKERNTDITEFGG